MQETNFKFSKKIFLLIFILALIGIALCCELSVIFYKTNFLPEFQKSFCTVSELIDCDGVALTQYSLSFGVPNALWGLLVYSLILFLLFVDRIQAKFKNTLFDVFENPRSYIATISTLTFSLSMILAFISIFKINKICALCFCTYFIDLAIALISRSKEGLIFDFKTTIADFIKGVKKYTILFIIVLISFVSTLYYLDSTTLLSPKLKKEKQEKEFRQAKSNKYAVKGNILGKENAKVKVTIYSDFNCPFCKILNIMIHKIAKNENILVEEKSFPLDTSCNNKIFRGLAGHETSCYESLTALAAKKQGKFYDVANVLYYNNFKINDEVLELLAKSNLGLDMQKLISDINSNEVKQELQNEIQQAANLGLVGTPAIDIDGVLYMGGMPYEELEQKIKLAVKRSQN